MGYDDDRFLGDEDEIIAASGDELDLAETVDKINPTTDELQAFANRRNMKHDLLNSQAPFVRDNPASALRGSLGNQVTLLAPAAGVAPSSSLQQIAFWPGDDVETRPVTVTLFPVDQVGPGGFASTEQGTRPYGVVQFGTHGALATAEVDVGRGVQFTVNGSQLTLQAGLERNPNSAALTQKMIVGGTVSFKPIMKTTPATRTLYFDAVPDVASVRPIPAFARSVMLLRGNAGIGGPDYSLAFFDSTKAFIYTYLVIDADDFLLPIPISDDAFYVSLTAAGAPHARLVFELSF